MASFAEPSGGAPRTELIRVEPGGVNLEKMTRLDQVASRVATGAISPADGRRRLSDILHAPARYGQTITILFYGISSAAAARFFNGGWREMFAAGVIGTLIGVISGFSGKRPALAPAADALSALLTALAAPLLAALIPPLAVQTVLLAALIVLIPGFTLTLALNELATRNLSSGTARLAAAGITFLQLGFGLALGTRLAQRWGGADLVAPIAAVPLPAWTLGVALLIAPLGFVVLFKAARRDTGWIVLAGLIAFAGARWGAGVLGPELGVFPGALALGLYGNFYARFKRRPAAVPVVPGLMFLVPGSLGLRSFSAFLENRVESGLSAVFTMALIAVSLVAGLLIANVIVSPKKSL